MNLRDWRNEMLNNPDTPPAMRELILNGGPGLPPRPPMVPADASLALITSRCRNCLGRLATRAERDNHVCDRRKRPHCNDCGALRTFESEDELMEHEASWHNICTQCRQRFNSDKGLERHLETHRGERAHCYGCHRTFPSASCMVRHHETRSCVSPTGDRAVYEAALQSEGRGMVVVREEGRPAVTTYPPREGYDGLRFKYKCTRCVVFPNVSEFLRHVEDGVCGLSLGSGGAMDSFLWELMQEIPMAWGMSCPRYSPS